MKSDSLCLPREDTTSSHHFDTDLTLVRRQASNERFPPTGTVRCIGNPLYRSRLARNLGLLLDLDDEVEAWTCLPEALEVVDADGVDHRRVPDFHVHYADGSSVYLDTGDQDLRPVAPGVTWRRVGPDEILVRPAIANAREMLRYARRIVPLGDRIRLLAYLEEAGTVTLVEAASAMRESHEAVGAVVALALQRVIRIDWRERRLSPDSRVEAVR